MRLFSLFKKTLLENVRDWKILLLTLIFAPLFVFLMYFYVGDAPQTYSIIFIDNDQGVITSDGYIFRAGDELIANMTGARYEDGTGILNVIRQNDTSLAYKRLIDRSADLVVEIPANFSSSLADYRDGKSQYPATVKSTGNPSNTKYIMAAVYSDMTTYAYAAYITGVPEPVQIQAETVDSSAGAGVPDNRKMFDLMVPGLLALSFMMLMFTTAASFIREKDKGTIVRLKLSGMRVYEFIGSIGIAQVIIGIAAMALTYMFAVALGFRSSGSLVAVLIISILTCLSIIAISLIVSSFLRSIFDLMTIGCIPFFILMFFSGGMFPLPPVPLFSLAGRTINVNYVLPTTHSIAAMDKVLNFGAGFSDLYFELAAIAILTAIYFAIGMWLFNRRNLKMG